MTDDEAAQAAQLLVATRRLVGDDPSALRVLADLDRRLREPLRVAVAGIVKAGKSTLLNALLGERIAPTDAGECTRVVTWYRHADSPSIAIHLRQGPMKRMPIRRSQGALVLDLGSLPIDEVDRIEIGWPSEVLRSVTLIDTPGIESLSHQAAARSAAFLAPDDAPSSADAIVYLMRHLHPKDLGFLEAFRDTAVGSSRTVNAIAVLSRADEIGSGRIDSLLSAAKVAARYERDGGLQSLALGVLPVAGLLAQGARTLRENDYAAFRTLAALDRQARERLLVSSDRFVRANAEVDLDVATRRQLLDHFGMYGVRLGASLIRVGVNDSSELAVRLVQQSGLHQLEQFISANFVARATVLKVRALTEGVAWLLRDRPADADSSVARSLLEQLQASMHGLQELALLSQVRLGSLPLPDVAATEVRRLVGGEGLSAAARLGLAEETDAAALHDALRAALDSWRARSNSPLLDRAALSVCGTIVRSLEEVSSEVGRARADQPTPDVVTTSTPGDSGR